MENINETGGARIGKSFMAWNYSNPFATLNASQNELTVQVDAFFATRRYTVLKNNVLEIVDYDGLFSKGILINHSDSHLPSTIIFWTSKRAELKKRLQELGFPVK
ncbi:MAG: hypothetical protein ACTHMT_11045 [Verrucomicrobiota bacterium]|jgi:hypothetical protein